MYFRSREDEQQPSGRSSSVGTVLPIPGGRAPYMISNEGYAAHLGWGIGQRWWRGRVVCQADWMGGAASRGEAWTMIK